MALVRSFLVVGVNVLGSRVLGFVRDILIAASLGAGSLADAWVVAFRIPNLFRRIFAEGAFNAAFIPLFAGRLESEGEASAKRFAEECFAALFTALVLVSLAAELAMPWLMRVIAPGFTADPDKLRVAVLFTRVAFPYLLFISLVALMSGMLNSLHRYALAAAAPILLNIVLIGALLFATPLLPSAGHALVSGVAFAGLLQFFAVAWGLSRLGMMPRLIRPRLTPGVKRLIALGVPGVIAGGITQVNILIGTMISTYEAGAASVLYYADRVYQLPMGVVGVAIGIVLLPELARRLRAGDDTGASDAQNRALEFALLLTLPAAVALIVIPGPITNVLFERGAFTAADAARTANALIAFGAGLPAFVLIKVLSPGFFAQEDTVTPLRYAGVSIVLNIVLSLLLFFPAGLGYLGIAIATSIASAINAALLGYTLRRRGLLKLDRRLLLRTPRIALASAVMGLAVAAAAAALWPDGASLKLRVFALAGLVGVGGLVYALACLVTGAAGIRDLRRAFAAGA
jgi:putative peptidoglycan lipid II flippase